MFQCMKPTLETPFIEMIKLTIAWCQLTFTLVCFHWALGVCAHVRDLCFKYGIIEKQSPRTNKRTKNEKLNRMICAHFNLKRSRAACSCIHNQRSTFEVCVYSCACARFCSRPTFNIYVSNGSSRFNDDLSSFFKLFQNDFQIKEH